MHILIPLFRIHDIAGSEKKGHAGLKFTNDYCLLLICHDGRLTGSHFPHYSLLSGETTGHWMILPWRRCGTLMISLRSHKQAVQQTVYLPPIWYHCNRCKQCLWPDSKFVEIYISDEWTNEFITRYLLVKRMANYLRIVNWTMGKERRVGNLNQNTAIDIQKNEFENVVFKWRPSLSRPPCVMDRVKICIWLINMVIGGSQ